MAELQAYRGQYYLWKYLPSQPAAIIFCIIYLLLTACICFKIFRTRTWYCIAFAVGGLLEFIGYAARAAAYYQTGKLMPFVIQNTFILIAPALFAATIYMTLGRLILQTNTAAHSFISPRWLTRTFVSVDVLSLLIQGSSAGLMVNTSTAETGKWLVIVGLLLQILGFMMFMAVGALWLRRQVQRPSLESYNLPWKSMISMLGACSLLIFVRSIFRVIEYCLGTDGFPLSHEWTLYIFDTILMVAAMGTFFWFYPSFDSPPMRGTNTLQKA